MEAISQSKKLEAFQIVDNSAGSPLIIACARKEREVNQRYQRQQKVRR